MAQFVLWQPDDEHAQVALWGVLSAQLSVDVIRETTNISVEEMQG